MDEEHATIESQFVAYAKLFESKTRSGETITLYNSDYWLRQANLLDDRKITMTDTDTLYCNATYDGYLCWPPTAAGETSYQHCPDIRLSDATKFAYRRCGVDGSWVGRNLNDTSPNGWTNYTPCFPAIVQNLFYKVYDDQGDAQLKFKIAQNTRYLELTGYAMSLLTTFVAIYVFSIFSGLNNKRTFIHKNLFWAIFLENFVRILLYSDQLIVRNKEQLEENLKRGIENMPYLCETIYVILEYSRLSVYAWMFIEGIYLHSLVTDRTLRKEISKTWYCVFGWLAPAIIVSLWAAVTANHYSGDQMKLCWYGYNYLPSYYIVQGPILFAVGMNYIFLICIMHVVIKKLRTSNDSELMKIKKMVRAALILLPLLGIGNVFHLFEYPLDGSTTGFAIWCYSTHFIRSFQGCLISVLYCFTNREVIKMVKKNWQSYMFRIRGDPERPRIGSGARHTPDCPSYHKNEQGENIPMTTLRRSQDPSTQQTQHDVMIEAEHGRSYDRIDEQAENIPMTTLRRSQDPSTQQTQHDVMIKAEPGPSYEIPSRRVSFEDRLMFHRIEGRQQLQPSPITIRRVSYSGPPLNVRYRIPGTDLFSPIHLRRVCSVPFDFHLPPPNQRGQQTPARVHLSSCHRPFTRPGLVTYDTQRRRASTLSMCYK